MPNRLPRIANSGQCKLLLHHKLINTNGYEGEGKKLTTYLDEKLRAEEEQDYLIWTGTHPEVLRETAHFGTLTLINDLSIEH